MGLPITRRGLLAGAFATPLLSIRGSRNVRVGFARDSAGSGAAAAAGFEVVCEDFESALLDRSIDAVSIDAPLEQRPRMVVEACRAGKDVWVAPPVCASREEGRHMVDAAHRYGRVVQAGTFWRSSQKVQEARRTIRSGALGKLVFCRAFEAAPGFDRTHLVDLLQFAVDDEAPCSVSAQGGAGNFHATMRYPGVVASYESRGTGDPGIAFHGERATLVLDPRDDGALEAHWAKFRECIFSRRKPISSIESAVRSATAWGMSRISR